MGFILGSFLLELLILLFSFLGYAVHRQWSKYYSLLKQGYKCVTPWDQLKADVLMLMGRLHLTELHGNRYQRFKKDGMAIISITPEVVFITDPDLINRILIKDFSHFHDRGFPIDEETNPLEGHLFMLSGERWRTMRNKLSPTFTSGKIKGMYPLMEDCVSQLLKGIKTKTPGELEVIDLLGCFTTDVIGSCAFGYEPTAIENPDCELRRLGKRAFRPTTKESVLGFFRFLFPDLMKPFRIRSVPKEVNDFFFSIVRQTFEERLRTGQKRQDFLQLLLQLREKGHVDIDPREEDDDEETTASSLTSTESTIELTDELLTAQAFVFFVAGFETSATALSYSLFEMAKNPDCQGRLRQEIQEVKSKHGSITYQALKEMTYLDGCINESLRMHPPITIMFRQCTKDYLTPSGLEIKKGSQVVLPVFAVQADPEYFPEPEKFRPERFQESTPPPGTFLPFGDGPRICIAKRFAMVEIKMGLAKILDQYEVSKCSRTEENPVLNNRSFILQPIAGIWLKFNEIKK